MAGLAQPRRGRGARGGMTHSAAMHRAILASLADFGALSSIGLGRWATSQNRSITAPFQPLRAWSVDSQDTKHEQQSGAEQSRSEQHAHRQRQHPGEDDIAHRRALKSRTVCDHRAGNAGR